VSNERVRNLEQKYKFIEKIISFVKDTNTIPDNINEFLVQKETMPITQKTKLLNLLLRPEVSIEELLNALKIQISSVIAYREDITDILEEVEILLKYDSYITKEEELAHRLSKIEHIQLALDFDYQSLLTLSFEAREKLAKYRPQTLGQASRISGVTPADIAVLSIYLNNKK
jgi:tRNA uridine 5-carboxymethylaminomethyl modification enzyme